MESLAFQQALIATDGVGEVRSVVLKEPAAAFEVESTTTVVFMLHQQEEDKKNKPWKALAIGGVAILVVLICLITGAVLIKRSQKPINDEATSNSAAEVDAEVGLGLVDASADGTAPTKQAVEDAKVATVDEVVRPEDSKAGTVEETVRPGKKIEL